LNNLWQYRLRNLFSITIICLSFLIFGVFLSLSNNLEHIAGRIARNMAVVMFLEPDLPEPDKLALEKTLLESDMVEDLAYVSSGEARERFRENFPDLAGIVDNMESNPFPPSFEATLRDENDGRDRTDEFIDRVRGLKGVEDVQYNREWVDRMQGFSRLAQAIGFFLGGILVLASFFIISNVIKLNVFARGDEIEILRLTGASNAFIRIPFLSEGIVLGLLGGLLSLLLLFLAIQIFPIYLGTSLGILNELIRFRYLSFPQSVAVVLAGAATGFIGSLSSLSRFLKT